MIFRGVGVIKGYVKRNIGEGTVYIRVLAYHDYKPKYERRDKRKGNRKPTVVKQPPQRKVNGNFYFPIHLLPSLPFP